MIKRSVTCANSLHRNCDVCFKLPELFVIHGVSDVDPFNIFRFLVLFMKIIFYSYFRYYWQAPDLISEPLNNLLSSG